MNKILKYAERISLRFGLRLDFSKGYNRALTTGVFSKHGLIRMLEAFDFECLDQVSRFLAAVTDISRVNEREPELSELITSYFEHKIMFHEKIAVLFGQNPI